MQSVLTLPDEFWRNEARELLAILTPVIEASARAGIAGTALQFNRELANTHAANWAATYTDELLRNLGTSQRRIVGDALAQWVNKPGSDVGELIQALSGEFGEWRADLIASTEITRAYAGGNEIAFQAAGVAHWRWNTNRDDMVCDTCRPLNGKVFAIGAVIGLFRGVPFTKPPAHPGCHCWMTPVVIQADQEPSRD